LAQKQRPPATPATTAVEALAPTAERLRHGTVDRLARPIADERGAPARPYRAIDILAQMERRGRITAGMRCAGDDFRTQFNKAHLDPLHAAALERVGGSSPTAEPGLKAQAARDRVWRSLCAVGGIASPAGSCLWHVVGYERSLKEWAVEQGWRGRAIAEETASGILIASLGMLEAHYDGRGARP
jgi:hypothetical protein